VATFRAPVCFMNFGLIPYRHRYCTYLYYLEGIGPHGGGVAGEVAEEPRRVERAPVAGWGGMRRSEKARVSEEAESLRQVGRAQGGVRRPKCQRRHY
jgi:hypothetical protein